MPEEIGESIAVEGVSTTEEAPATENNTTEAEVETEASPADETAATEESTEESEPQEASKKSAQGRIKQLNNELKQERQKRSALEEKVNSILKENETNPFSPVNMPLPDPSSGRLAQPNQNGEITYEDYQRDVQQNAQAAVKAVLSQQQLRQQALDLVREYPQLDPNSDQYDADLSDAIIETVEAKHRLSSNFDLKATVEKQMKPYRRSAEVAVEAEKRNLAQQVASAGIRPGSSPVVEAKQPEDESIEEMEARLGKVY